MSAENHERPADLESRARKLFAGAKWPLTREQIADALWLSYADTGRLLCDLRAAGVVEIVATRTAIRYRLTNKIRDGGEP